MNMIEQMKKKDGFSDSYRVLADYIVSREAEILSMSVQELAAVTFTSPSTVVRFSRHLGASGFQDFKIRYARELEQQLQNGTAVDPNFPFKKGDSVRNIAASILQLSAESLMESYQLIYRNEALFRKAAEKLVSAERRIIIGIGFSNTSALAFQNRLMRIGYHFFMTSINGEIEHLCETCTEHDAALLLTYSGTTRSVTEAASILRSRGSFIICLTSNPDSPAARDSDLVIQMPEKEQKFMRFANFSSQACMEYYLNVLYSYIFVMNYDIHSADTIV